MSIRPRTHLLLVPGLNCTEELFAPQRAALAELCSISIGYHRQDDSLQAIAQRILEAAPARFALAGLSMGGYIAFEILRQAPDRVERLMLLDTNARADNEEQRGVREGMIRIVEDGDFARVNAMQWLRLVHENRREDRALRAIIDAMAEATGAAAYIRQQRAIMERPDSRPFLMEIRCPTTIIVGDGDVITPPKVSEEMRAGIPGSTLIVIPDCGHLSSLEAPEAVSHAMAKWLTGA
jgi:pimeloyl-ACP methyl ester carboxylesterase